MLKVNKGSTINHVKGIDQLKFLLDQDVKYVFSSTEERNERATCFRGDS